jgi:hypothetical protein
VSMIARCVRHQLFTQSSIVAAVLASCPPSMAQHFVHTGKLMNVRERVAGAAAERLATLSGVGNDGGEKVSSSKPIGAVTLFATIDTMPMRREDGAALTRSK